MVTFGQVPLKEIWAMLEECAPGHTVKTRDHNHCVRWSGKTYPSLPRGKHGRRDNPPIEVGHVKQMVRQLGIDPECVKRTLPQLQLK
jgi:hypothetical protein